MTEWGGIQPADHQLTLLGDTLDKDGKIFSFRDKAGLGHLSPCTPRGTQFTEQSPALVLCKVIDARRIFPS